MNFTEAALPSQPPQRSLPLDFAPILLREHGLAAAHEMPRVGDRQANGVMWSKRVPAERAWVHRWVQIDDAGSTWAAITLDCDNREAMAAGLGELPSPNFIVNTRRGAHLYWCLKNPVAKHNAARPRPLRMLARVSEYFACRAGADKAFNGLGRNPTHVEAETHFLAPHPYTLTGLNNTIPAFWRRPQVAFTTIGRNYDMFTTGLRWAGSWANRDLPVLPVLMGIYDDVLARYPDKDHSFWPEEVERIAGRVEAYRERWRGWGWHDPNWIELQRSRGRQGGLKSRGGGRRRLFTGGEEPWTLEGIKRDAYYKRRQRAGNVHKTSQHR